MRFAPSIVNRARAIGAAQRRHVFHLNATSRETIDAHTRRSRALAIHSRSSYEPLNPIVIVTNECNVPFPIPGQGVRCLVSSHAAGLSSTSLHHGQVRH